MSYISLNAERYLNKIIGTGQCVAFVQIAAGTPWTHLWKQGTLVKNNYWLPRGSAIATFENGIYQNDTTGHSHAAIYLRQDAKGIYVLDQWKNPDNSTHPVSERLIRFKHGIGKPVNDADQYWVIE